MLTLDIGDVVTYISDFNHEFPFVVTEVNDSGYTAELVSNDCIGEGIIILNSHLEKREYVLLKKND